MNELKIELYLFIGLIRIDIWFLGNIYKPDNICQGRAEWYLNPELL